MGKFSNVAHYQDFTELKKILSASAANTYDMDKIEKAYKFAEKAHGDQRRVSGIPYILHPVSVAVLLQNSVWIPIPSAVHCFMTQ